MIPDGYPHDPQSYNGETKYKEDYTYILYFAVLW